MFNQLRTAAETIIGRLIDFAQAKAWLVIAASLLAATGTAYYTATHIGINTDTTQMLSEHLPWRIARAAYKEQFPYFSDTIVIVIDGATPDVARDSATELVGALRNDNTFISDVYFPSDDEFLRQNQLLYLDTDELKALGDQLSAAQPFLARLTQERSVVALFELLDQALESGVDGATSTLGPALRRIGEALDQLNNGNEIPMSWQALLTGESPEPSRTAIGFRQIILVTPVLDFSALLPAEPAIEAIRNTVSELELDTHHGATVRLTGDAALSYDELRSVITGSQNAGTAALMMVLVCLLVGLRSLSLVAATLVSLIVGLIFTAGFATVCVGTLNMISIAFAVLYVGLGVDFAIHICLRYREMLTELDPDKAVRESSRDVGLSLILCSTTTAIGFFAFIPTAYRGVAELGLIAGVGMFVSLAVSIVLLPALLHVLPKPDLPRRMALLPDRIASFPRKNSRGVLGVATVVWILAALSIPGAEFDIDPVNLNDPSAQSVVTFRELLNDPEQSPLAIATTANSRLLAEELVAKLKAISAVSSVRFIDSFVPENQADKLALVDDLALTLGFDFGLAEPPRVDVQRTSAATDKLRAGISKIVQQPEHELRDHVLVLEQALSRFQESLSALSQTERLERIGQLDQKLLASFAPRVALLQDGLNPQEVSIESLPTNIRQRWLSSSGHYRIEAYPKTDLSKPGEMRRFAVAAQAVLGDTATGAPIIYLGGSDAVKSAFIQAFSYAFVVITALLWIILRSIKETSIVLAPLILAGLLTAAMSTVFSLPFNFANIIALPLLLGIGVDSALHMLHRYKTALPEHGNLLQTSTARAVFFSALTTIVSFGNLATSTHAGTASMGVMLSIGVVSTLTCMLLVLPAMLKQFMPHAPHDE
ncbi:MAG: hopanoid biosynthesis associated RND transporter like protein HpnN [Gammaproteobacteria bacterium]|jgi:hopanoid biosynthesis associated RND transporter like protein HpnN